MEGTDTQSERDYAMMSCLTGVRRSVCVCACDCVRCVGCGVNVSFRNNHFDSSKPTSERKYKQRTEVRPSYILERHRTANPARLTLCTALPFVADGAHAVAIGAGAVAAAKRVDALRDGDVALGSLPAAVAHTGALVVLAVATAQHRAGRCRNGEREGRGRLNSVHDKRKTISGPFRDPQSSEKPCHPHTHPRPPNPTNTSPCRRANRVVKGLESGNDIKSNYRQR